MDAKKFSLEFDLTIMPLTLNELMGKHWRSRHSNFKAIHKFIHAITIKSRPPEPIKKARVSIWRFSSGSLDRDNLYFTFKPIIDGLVQSGVIIDDGFDQVRELFPHQVKTKRGEPRKVVVRVEEL